MHQNCRRWSSFQPLSMTTGTRSVRTCEQQLTRDVAAFTDSDRIREAKRTNAAGDFGDLRYAVGPGVARIRHQPIGTQVFDLKSSSSPLASCSFARLLASL